MRNFENYLNILGTRLQEIIALVVPPEKKETFSGLLSRYVQDLIEKLQSIDDEPAVREIFAPFVNDVMSMMETLELSKDSFRAVRRLLLNEIYSCLNKAIVPSLGGLDADSSKEG